jgi:beta-lactamase regulating signal transducer with metallopeptidase domain
MDTLLTAFIAQITTATPTIVGVIGAIIGLVVLVVLGRFIISRVRGSVK